MCVCVRACMRVCLSVCASVCVHGCALKWCALMFTLVVNVIVSHLHLT